MVLHWINRILFIHPLADKSDFYKQYHYIIYVHIFLFFCKHLVSIDRGIEFLGHRILLVTVNLRFLPMGCDHTKQHTGGFWYFSQSFSLSLWIRAFSEFTSSIYRFEFKYSLIIYFQFILIISYFSALLTCLLLNIVFLFY